MPLKRARANAAILQAIDKVTAETIRFEAPVGQPIRYKSLVFTVRACETAAPDELAPESVAYIVVDSEPRPRPGRARRPSRQTSTPPACCFFKREKTSRRETCGSTQSGGADIASATVSAFSFCTKSTLCTPMAACF